MGGADSMLLTLKVFNRLTFEPTQEARIEHMLLKESEGVIRRHEIPSRPT